MIIYAFALLISADPRFYKFIACTIQQQAGKNVEACGGFLGRAPLLKSPML